MSQELAIIEEWKVPALNLSSTDAMEELGGLTITFDRIRIPSGGGTAWEVPDSDNVSMQQEIVGVIVHHHAARAYWMQAYKGGGQQPDCSSLDGVTGIATNTELEWYGTLRECATCPMNTWGSADGGRGKACRELHRLYILREGDVFPVLITLPPTSLKVFAGYIARRILPLGVRLRHVVTVIGLAKAKNAQGIAYSQATFRPKGILSVSARNVIDQYAEQLRAVTAHAPVSGEDYVAEAAPDL